MIKIKVIASSSKGNAVLVDDGETKVLLDAGIPVKQIGRTFRPSELAGVFVTHLHKDHCLAVRELCYRGIRVFMSKGTKEADENHRYSEIIEVNEVYQIGTFRIKPFRVVHDVKDPLGFLLYSDKAKKKILYMVDTGIIPAGVNRFKGITHLLIEANHDVERLENVDLLPIVKKRIAKNHLSIQEVCSYLKRMDQSKLEQIHLLHLSEKNSNMMEFQTKIQALTGVPVFTKRNHEREYL